MREVKRLLRDEKRVEAKLKQEGVEIAPCPSKKEGRSVTSRIPKLLAPPVLMLACALQVQPTR